MFRCALHKQHPVIEVYKSYLENGDVNRNVSILEICEMTIKKLRPGLEPSVYQTEEKDYHGILCLKSPCDCSIKHVIKGSLFLS